MEKSTKQKELEKVYKAHLELRRRVIDLDDPEYTNLIELMYKVQTELLNLISKEIAISINK